MYFFIVYNSITFVNRIKDYFKYDSNYIGVVHTPSDISRGGCSYSLKVTNKEIVRQILEVSKRYNFNVRGVYKQLDNGNFSEVLI